MIMRTPQVSNQKGITLIELLIALVICGMVAAGTYRLFIAQNKAYIVQDQVADVQQNIRSAMELMVRDLRMTGYDDDSLNSTVTPPDPPIVHPIQGSDITVSYEYYDTIAAQYRLHTIRYWRDAPSSTLFRQCTGCTNPNVADPPEILLENVDALNLTYGVDEDANGGIDDRDADGKLVSPRAGPVDETDWLPAATVNAKNLKAMAIRIVLTARPTQVNPDVGMIVSPRTLTSTVTLRNLYLMT
jgi:prepilin-type N-terminal cleavage/methylation domain-containing protein